MYMIRLLRAEKQGNDKYKILFNGCLLGKADVIEKEHTGVPIHIGNDLVLKLCGEFMGVYFLIMLHNLIIIHVFFSMHQILPKMFLKDLEITYLELNSQ